MSRYKFAAASLAFFALAGIVRAQDPAYNVASDWATTYPTTTALASATTATWGAGGAWSAGVLSYNWTNENGSSVQYLGSYYNANSVGAETSAGTTVSTFTYTVPFAAYQFNPGSTVQQQVGPVVPAQVNSGFTSITGSAVTLPKSGSSFVATGTTTSGTIQIVPNVNTGYVSTEKGFVGVKAGTMKDGGGTVESQAAAVYYNYGTTNATGTGIAMQNAASGSLDNVVMMEGALGPGYVAWTAPSAGTLTSVAINAWDVHESQSDDDGLTGFAIYASSSHSSLGSPLFTALNNNGSGGVGSMQSYEQTYVGSGGNIAALSGYPTTGTSGASFGVGWTDSSLAVTAGEVIWMIADPGHTYNGNHAFLGGADPIALQASFNFVPTPEPGSLVLLITGGIGLALSAWRKRRGATA